VLARIEERSRI